jgi:hypothetical protein
MDGRDARVKKLEEKQSKMQMQLITSKPKGVVKRNLEYMIRELENEIHVTKHGDPANWKKSLG